MGRPNKIINRSEENIT